MAKEYAYYAFHKPYGVLCQFKKEIDSHITLADYIDLPSDIYPIGRLDKDSEGLILLTNDNVLKTNILAPKTKCQKVYLVQLDNNVTESALEKLRKGVLINLKGKKHKTLPAKVEKLNNPPPIPDREPPVRYRKNIPTSWIRITIHEGKNRQVRRMCAAVGFPVLRLIRIQISKIRLGHIEKGELKKILKSDIL